MSCMDLLTVHRELLVSRLKSVQCVLDNLAACGFFCEEDVDIVQQTVTRTEKVGRANTSQVLDAVTRHSDFCQPRLTFDFLTPVFCPATTRRHRIPLSGTFKG